MRARQVAEHRQEVIEFETYLGLAQTLHNKIEQAVDPEWLEAIKSPTFGFTHLTPKQMLEHLLTNGVELDDNDVTALIKQLYEPWNLTENPVTKFARNDKIEKQLLKKGIAVQPLVRLALAKSAFQATGEYEVTLNTFESKPTPDQTFANFRPFIIEFSKHHKNDKQGLSQWVLVLPIKLLNRGISLPKKRHMSLKWNVQAASNKKMEAFMDFTKDTLKQLVSANKSNGGNGNGNNNNNNNNGNRNGNHNCVRHGIFQA